jgi:hypothetical protein
MKHIKTFEGMGSKIDKDYIRSVFSDFIDEGAFIEITNNPNEDDTVCRIKIPNPLGTMQQSIDSLIKVSENHTTVLVDIVSCVGRVRDEFPGISSSVDYYHDPKYIIVRFSI